MDTCIRFSAGYAVSLFRYRIVTADFVYVRLHGPTKNKYQGSYSDSQLKEWAEFCKVQVKDNKDVFVYFDNDQEGYAAFNAIRLKELVK